jgi:hypothetical protein
MIGYLPPLLQVVLVGYRAHKMSSATLESLAAEFKLAIIDLLDVDDKAGKRALLSLSQASRAWRTLCLPKVFSSITIDDDEERSKSLRNLPESPYAAYVKSLCFKPDLQGWMDEVEFEYIPPENAPDEALSLPEGFTMALFCLDRFPNLERFVLDYGVEVGDCTIFNWLTVEEETERIPIEERTYEWRAMLAQTFKAILRNERAIKCFRMENVIAKPVSIWSSPRFRELLGALDEFSISICGIDCDYWTANAVSLEGYRHFAFNMPECFFSHLNNITKFSFATSVWGPYGLTGGDGGSHIEFELRPEHMPRLESLHLSHVFICPNIVTFITHHSLLEVIKLENCWSGIKGGARNAITWSDFFNSLADNCPVNLQSFEIWPRQAPISKEDINDYQVGGEDVKEEKTDDVRRALEADPDKFVFAYASLHDKYTYLVFHLDTNIDAFIEEDDQQSYNKLISIVENNARERAG